MSQFSQKDIDQWKANREKSATDTAAKIIDLQSENSTINTVRMALGFAGSIAGIVYANKTGGKFWRYVGFWFLGGAVVGIPTTLATIPKLNKNLAEIKKLKLNATPKKVF